jgi:predicted nuclease with TOPRIM domain
MKTRSGKDVTRSVIKPLTIDMSKSAEKSEMSSLRETIHSFVNHSTQEFSRLSGIINMLNSVVKSQNTQIVKFRRDMSILSDDYKRVSSKVSYLTDELHDFKKKSTF